jgi:hypothetical protein
LRSARYTGIARVNGANKRFQNAAELQMHRLGYHDVRRSRVSSVVGIVVALSAATGIAALLTIVSTVPRGDSAFARAQPAISVVINRRLKSDRLELPASVPPAEENTLREIIRPGIAPAAPLESMPNPSIGVTRKAGFTLAPAEGSEQAPKSL